MCRSSAGNSQWCKTYFAGEFRTDKAEYSLGMRRNVLEFPINDGSSLQACGVQPTHAPRCIDLLASEPIWEVIGHALVRRGPLPVRLIHYLADRAPEAIVVADSFECSVLECAALTRSGTEVVILAMLPHPSHARRYTEAGAAAYLPMTVGGALIATLTWLAGPDRPNFTGGSQPTHPRRMTRGAFRVVHSDTMNSRNVG